MGKGFLAHLFPHAFTLVNLSQAPLNLSAMLTMPERVHIEADAMWGTMTALGHCSRPGFIAGSSSNTSSPHLCGKCMGAECDCTRVRGWGTAPDPAGFQVAYQGSLVNYEAIDNPTCFYSCITIALTCNTHLNSGLAFRWRTRAASSITGPRAALTSTALGFIILSFSSLIRWRVFLSRLQCRLTT